MFKRELIRLEASLKAAGERPKLCFLHYPPLYQGLSLIHILAEIYAPQGTATRRPRITWLENAF